jgi:hypothetical protein
MPESTIPTAKDKQHRAAGIRALIGGVILDFWIGCFFIWANIAIYVLSHLRTKGMQPAYEHVL